MAESCAGLKRSMPLGGKDAFHTDLLPCLLCMLIPLDANLQAVHRSYLQDQWKTFYEILQGPVTLWMLGLDGRMGSGKRTCKRVGFCWLLSVPTHFGGASVSWQPNTHPKSTGAKEEKVGVRGGVQLGHLASPAQPL